MPQTPINTQLQRQVTKKSLPCNLKDKKNGKGPTKQSPTIWKTQVQRLSKTNARAKCQSMISTLMEASELELLKSTGKVIVLNTTQVPISQKQAPSKTTRSMQNKKRKKSPLEAKILAPKKKPCAKQ